LERPGLSLRIRTLERGDIAAVLAIQRACPEVAQWSAADYESVARGEMAGWIADERSRAAGFLIARHLVQEMEILNLAVRPDCRRRGVGTRLLRAVLSSGEAARARQVTLEVRASNRAGLAFYERHKFRLAGRRRAYYRDPIDDALLLALDLKPAPRAG
jgi:[ribosomal protein S18]-alanine N-acetyltransferase